VDGARKCQPLLPQVDAAPDLVVVVGATRSGTTLLRLLLDSHPEIGARAEAGIPNLISNLCRVWQMIGTCSCSVT